MLFNSIEFFVFLPIFFVLYWFITNRNRTAQNILVIIASYIFYGWWDWHFLLLIFLSTVVDFSVGILLSKEKKEIRRKILLWISVGFNLGCLGFFKYYNFFVESFITAFYSENTTSSIATLNIILPVGISFYTFQTMSYTIDVYKKKLEPTKSFLAFMAFVSFFPQLVAGPIERASHLLPQFLKDRKFNYQNAVSAISLIIWGLFKKVVIADNAAQIVNGIYGNYEHESYISLIVGMIFFSFQIYGDFSGYSDIAIGLSRLFGFDLMYNFKFPYFSSNIREFWSRWHISLSTWFRDYLYIPLGGNKLSRQRTLLNTFIVFLLSGLWHGANWTFVFWGVLHALLFFPVILFREKFPKQNSVFNIKRITFIVTNFILVSIAWVFFRAETIKEAFVYLHHTFLLKGGQNYFQKNNSLLLMSIITFLSVFILLIFEFKTVKKNKSEIVFSTPILIVIILLTCLLGSFKNQSDFIYFQF